MAKPHRQHQDLLPGQGQDGEGGESWLLSYLDVLTLLITLFVLLLSLAGNGTGEVSDARSERRQISEIARQAAVETSGVLPRHSGLLPELEGHLPDGIAMSRRQEGVTLRIDDTLLFSSGQAELTGEGKALLSRLNELLLAFRGRVSVEGHTDSVPIATARFPSNWELSGARAIAVLRHLQELGVPAERLCGHPAAGGQRHAGRAWRQPAGGAGAARALKSWPLRPIGLESSIPLLDTPMSDLPAPNAPSLEELHSELLHHSRFLGLPQWLWGLLLGSLVYAGALFWGATPPLATWALCVLACWALVELAFLPRRLEAKRLARYLRRQELTRLAIRHGISLSQVR